MKMIIIIDMLIPELHKLFVSFVRLVKDLNLKLTVMEANTVLVSIILFLLYFYILKE